ncbi:MAG: CHAT domain-containing protein [Planctomycetes bacterium]|nr:CHAT domain-containing protein [Planctomycetota bacterium]MCB9912049.1 CHAT domain-containing protein [Planctomycetota bacterium]HPF13506.1 CHAT domain-containing protein [Planctomycetota bacterium]
MPDQAAATHTAAHSLSKAELQAIAERLQGAGRLKGTVPSAEMVRTWRRLAEDCQPAADTTGEPQWIYYLIAELGVGTALQEAGEWKASAEHLEAVLAHENGLAPSWWAQMHAIAAESYLIGGLLGLAQPHVERGLELADQALQAEIEARKETRPNYFNRVGYVEPLLTAAKFALNSEYVDPAIGYLERVMDLTFPDGSKPSSRSIGTARRLLALVYYRQYFESNLESDQRVVEAYRSALEIEDLDPRDRFSCWTRLAHLHLEAGRYAAAEECLQAIGEVSGSEFLDAYDRAWYASLRNRLLREQGAGSDPTFRQAWSELLEHMRSTERDGGVGFFNIGRIREISAEAMLQALASDGMEAALATVFDSQEVGFLRAQLKAGPGQLADLRQSLEPQDLCLLFLAGRNRVHAFAIRGQGAIQHWEFEGGPLLRERATQLAVQVFQQPSSGEPFDSSQAPWVHAAAKLQQHLFEAAPPDLFQGVERIRVVGRETLYNPLLELLSVEGQPFGLTYAMEDWPTVGVGLSLLAKQAGSADSMAFDWLLLSDPTLSPEAAALIPTREPLAMEFPQGKRILELRGNQASLAAWRDHASTQVVQFLCHGVQRKAPEWSACLALAGDSLVPSGLVSGFEILRETELRAPQLAILSICRAQAGAARYGDPSAGRLAGVLLAKGSLAVLTSRGDANVYLVPTRRLTEAVRIELAQGRRLDEAVLAARRQLAQDPDLGSAIHWAAWQVIGLGSLTLDLSPDLLLPGGRPPDRRWWWGTAGLSVIALLAWGWMRQRGIRKAA